MESASQEKVQLGGEDEDQLPRPLPGPPVEGLKIEPYESHPGEDAAGQDVLVQQKGMKCEPMDTGDRPVPKLERCSDEHGIPILPHMFKDVGALKRKAQQGDNLGVVQRYLQHWVHRLFPTMPFHEVLERIDRMGTKRDVQTCIKKMRMDVPVLGRDADLTGDDDEGDEDDKDAERRDGSEAKKRRTSRAEELFGSLLREGGEKKGADIPARTNVKVEPGSLVKVVASTASSSSSLSSSSSSSSQHCYHGPGPSSACSGVSEVLPSDVLEKMDRSRRRVRERRHKVSEVTPCQPGSTSTPSQH